jgi:enoyl-CoA hydratase/carnithine racemase
MSLDLKVVTYDVDQGVATVTLNRPDRLNAWTVRMAEEFRQAIDTAAADSTVGSIVVTGAGRGFCPGADSEALGGLAGGMPYRDAPQPAAAPGGGGAPVRADFGHSFSFLLGVEKPVIAAVNGPAAGVGFVLLCFCDIRFAAAGAKITTSFARLGLPAEHGVSWLLPRLIGAGRAADLLLSSRVVLAEEACEMGLVNRVLPADELLPATLDYARALANEVSPQSLRTIKAQLYGDLLGGLDASAIDAEALMHDSFGGPDFVEGVTALREKRPPRFR